MQESMTLQRKVIRACQERRRRNKKEGGYWRNTKSICNSDHFLFETHILAFQFNLKSLYYNLSLTKNLKSTYSEEENEKEFCLPRDGEDFLMALLAKLGIPGMWSLPQVEGEIER